MTSLLPPTVSSLHATKNPQNVSIIWVDSIKKDRKLIMANLKCDHQAHLSKTIPTLLPLRWGKKYPNRPPTIYKYSLNFLLFFSDISQTLTVCLECFDVNSWTRFSRLFECRQEVRIWSRQWRWFKPFWLFLLRELWTTIIYVPLDRDKLVAICSLVMNRTY